MTPAHPPPIAGAVPANATADADGIMLGVGRVEVDVYVDLHSVPCRKFEVAVGSALDEMVGTGEISLAYHPVAMLDGLSTNRYSSRASASSGCASDGGRFREYVRALFARQPPQYAEGLTDEELIQIGADVGLTDPTFVNSVRTEQYEEWTVWVTVQAGDRGVNWWPTAHVRGVPVRANAEAIRAAVAAA